MPRTPMFRFMFMPAGMFIPPPMPTPRPVLALSRSCIERLPSWFEKGCWAPEDGSIGPVTHRGNGGREWHVAVHAHAHAHAHPRGDIHRPAVVFLLVVIVIVIVVDGTGPVDDLAELRERSHQLATNTGETFKERTSIAAFASLLRRSLRFSSALRSRLRRVFSSSLESGATAGR
jgi:hypothetical protein